MVTFLITSVLFIALVAIVIYLWQKPRQPNEYLPLPPSNPPRGLFSEAEAPLAVTHAETNAHQELISRATAGDLKAISDARELGVYSDVLTAAVIEANTEAKLLRLASHVSQSRLPVNRSLAQAMISSWQDSPNRHTTAKAIHFAALADDAELFCNAVELAVRIHQEGRLNDMSANELLALLNGEYWLLSAGERNSGAGFILKRDLSSARRELEGTTNI